MITRRLGAALLGAAAITVTMASATTAVQTFPDPFGGDGVFVDIRAGSQGEDIGDAFFLRDGAVLRIRMFLDDPNDFGESQVCLSAVPFTERLPPGSCQFQAQGAAASSYDIGLPPATFPDGTVPFDDPLGAFCTQVHVHYTAPDLSTTEGGGGTAYGGWQSGQPFFGNLCFPPVTDPDPPGEGTASVEKVGEVVDGDIVFTVTVSNPTAEPAADVVVWEGLSPRLTWDIPPACTQSSVDFIARCEIGDLDGGASEELVFSATLPADVCGTFGNFAAAFVETVAVDAELVIVALPCPLVVPPDPLILLTKEASASSISAPGTITYVVTFENAGPGTATNVTAVDELPPGPEWSIGSGANVCSLEGTTLTCSADEVPDGVFEVLEITGTLDDTDCGTLDNQATVEFEGGPEPGSVTALAPSVEVGGCPGATPSPGAPGGGLPDTSTLATPGQPPIAITLLLAGAATGASLVGLRILRKLRTGRRAR